MLWFKIVWFNIFQTSLIFFFVSDYDNEHETKGNKNKTGLKKFKPQSHIIIQWQGAL